jgi:flagellar biosynthesis protein FlhF
MKMKSYFAPTVQEAMEQARQEMGPEALLVNSRKAPPEAQGLGEYEVVFAVLPEEPVAPSAEASPAAADPVIGELARLRNQVQDMVNALNAHASHWAVPAPEFAPIFGRLVENDFTIDITRKILMQAYARLNPNPGSRPGRKPAFDSESIENAVRAEIESLMEVDASLAEPDEKTRVVALVGPAGSGKTTTLVKLAVRYGLACSRPVQLISADTRRIAAVEQLRTYAAIIGAGFEAVETTRSLQQVIEANREKGLILIDTPGYGARDMEEASELARFLARQSNIEIHLVVPASMRAANLSRTVDRFGVFSSSRLIFTQLDEASTFGAVVSESVRSGKPVSFLTTGQQIPDDIEPATTSRLLEDLFTASTEAARSAA